MDTEDARRQAEAATSAYHFASRPPVPVLASAVAGLFAGAGVALLGQPAGGVAKVATFVGGLLLVGAAHLLPTLLRARSGLHGYRGMVHRENLTFLVVAVALAVAGLGATSTLSTIFIGLGVVSGVAYFLLLRGWLGRSS